MTESPEDHDLREALSRQHPSAVPNSLCNICQQTVANSWYIQQALGNRPQWLPQDNFEYAEDLDALRESAYGGCHLCSLIYACVSTKASSETRTGNVTLNLMESVHQNDLVVRQRPLFDLQVTSRASEPSRGSELYAALGEDIWEEGQYTQRDVENVPLCWTTAGDEAFTLARAWIAQCCTSHLACMQQIVERVLPTRLLYICDDPVSIRLILSRDAPEDLEYTALSYRWGEKVPGRLLLTGDNMIQMFSSIAYASLPAVFQDAIVVTEKLGYRYLWIDGLCIDQSSSSDFEREAANMGRYYHQAICNIAALSGENPHDPLFMSRNPLCRRPLEIKAPEGRSSVFINRSFNRRLSPSFTIEFWTPLTSRAWVQQEKLLSPRTLYYAREGMHWECRQICASEHLPCLHLGETRDLPRPGMPRAGSVTFGMGLTRDAREEYAGKEALEDLLLRDSKADPDSHRRFRRTWRNLISFYTECEITYPEDRLHAIAGIVNIIQAYTERTAAFGLWEDDLVLQLLWKRYYSNKNDKIGQRLLGIAPTWSWGSVDGKILVGEHLRFGGRWEHFREREKRECCQARIVEVSHLTENDATTLLRGKTGCEITLEHSLFRVTRSTGGGLSFAPGDPWLVYTDETSFPLHWRGRETAFIRFQPDLETREGDVFWLVPMVQESSERDAQTWTGLVIKPVDDGRLLWTRVGTFEHVGNLPSNGRRRALNGEERFIEETRCIILV